MGEGIFDFYPEKNFVNEMSLLRILSQIVYITEKNDNVDNEKKTFMV